MNGNIATLPIKNREITTVELVIVGMEQFLPVFMPCEILNFLPEVLFVPLVNFKVWVSPECVW